ncbi:MAG: DNA starvation/stationary phase protection protein [Pseudomonadota bacterium]
MQNTATQLEQSAIDAVVEGLTQGLSETVVTTMKAQNYHWNVTGMAFGPLHALFQKIYEDHFEGQDDLAERIKALDGHALGTLAGHLARAKVNECEGRIEAKAMIENLQRDQQTLAGTMYALGEIATKHGDTLTEDLAIERGRTHEKFAWMLGAHLQG